MSQRPLVFIISISRGLSRGGRPPLRTCHCEEYPKGTCFAARSDAAIRSQRGTAALTGRRGRRPLRSLYGKPACLFVGGDAHIAPPWEIAFRRRDTRIPPYRVYVSGRTGSSAVMQYLPVPVL